MEVVSGSLVKDKNVLLRYDLDVIVDGKIDDFRLKAGLPTLNLCLKNASKVIMMGHICIPCGREVDSLSIAPIYQWFKENGFKEQLASGKFRLLENLRFEPGEDAASLEYAKNLASLGNFYVNEAFASYHPAASTTILPTLLPHAAGLRFVAEVAKLTEIRNNPKVPFIGIIGGAKIEDKLPVINALAEKATAVLVGGKLAKIVHEESFNFPHHILAGHLRLDGLDIAPQTIEAWRPIIKGAKTIIWNGPVGKIEAGSAKGTSEIAKILLETEAQVIIGGGDTVGFLNKAGFLKKFQEKGAFISSGGGAMLEFLAKGTLPTIGVLD